jgi:hypothetical protein
VDFGLVLRSSWPVDEAVLQRFVGFINWPGAAHKNLVPTTVCTDGGSTASAVEKLPQIISRAEASGLDQHLII